MTKTLFILIVFISGQMFGQKNIFELNLQNKNSLIKFVSRSSEYHYRQCIKQNDSVIVKRDKYPKVKIDPFLDSLKKIGYSDKSPKIISSTKYECKLKLLNIKYHDLDTLKDNKIDTIYIVDIEVNISYPKTKFHKTQTYHKLYTRSSADRLKKLFDSYDGYVLDYFSKANIYHLSIDFSFCTSIDKFRFGYQTGQLYQNIYF